MLNNINRSYEKKKINSKEKKSVKIQNKYKNKIYKVNNQLNYNIIVTKRALIPNNITFNSNNITSINTNRDYISILNNINLLIKDHFQNNQLYISNIRLISESINEQTLFSRSATNDILLYLNQIVKPRYNGTMANMNEKYIKDKLYQINLRMDKIIDLKNSMLENIDNNETSLISFYEEINNLLSTMRNIISKKGEKDKNNDKNNVECECDINLNDFKSGKNKKEFNHIEIIKNKYLEIYLKEKKKYENDDNFKNIKKNISSSSAKERNKKKNLNVKSIRPNSYSRNNTEINIKSLTNELIENKNIKESFDEIDNKFENNCLNMDNECKNTINTTNNNTKLKDIINLTEKENNLKIITTEEENKTEKDENIKLNNNIKIKEENSKNGDDIIINQKIIKLNEIITQLKEENKKLNNNIYQIKEQNTKINNELVMKKVENNKLIDNKKLIEEENKIQINDNKNLKEENIKLNNIISKIEDQNKNLLILKLKNNSNINQLNLELNSIKNKYKNEKAEFINKLKILEKDNLLIKTENENIKKQIYDIINKNEIIIKEKDKIINELNENIKELNNKLKNINDINMSIISGNIKDFKFNNINDEEMDNIKYMLTELNEKANININKILDREKKFNDIKDNYNKIINEHDNTIYKYINDYKNEYNELLKQLKLNNNIFTQLNKN